MASDINVAVPPLGNATTAGVRANFAAAKAEIESLQRQIGFVDYNDSATAVTPINVVASTWTKLTNNKLGPYSVTNAMPEGVTNLWNAVTNQLVLTELPVKAMLEFRADIVVTTTGANQVVKSELALAIGDAIAFSLPTNEMTFKAAGAHNILANIPFYIGSLPVKTNPGEFRLWSDGNCTVKVNGWYIRIMKYLGD